MNIPKIREYFVPLIPVLLAGAVAWGMLSNQVSSQGTTMNGNTSKIEKLTDRMTTSERSSEMVLTNLEYIKKGQDRMSEKLDKMSK
jgi:hypothetical protein